MTSLHVVFTGLSVILKLRRQPSMQCTQLLLMLKPLNMAYSSKWTDCSRSLQNLSRGLKGAMLLCRGMLTFGLSALCEVQVVITVSGCSLSALRIVWMVRLVARLCGMMKP